MGEAADQIEHHIERTREDLGVNLQELEQKVKRATDWRTYFRRNPIMLMGAAFGVGLLLAFLTNGRQRAWEGPPIRC